MRMVLKKPAGSPTVRVGDPARCLLVYRRCTRPLARTVFKEGCKSPIMLLSKGHS